MQKLNLVRFVRKSVLPTERYTDGEGRGADIVECLQYDELEPSQNFSDHFAMDHPLYNLATEYDIILLHLPKRKESIK